MRRLTLTDVWFENADLRRQLAASRALADQAADLQRQVTALLERNRRLQDQLTAAHIGHEWHREAGTRMCRCEKCGTRTLDPYAVTLGCVEIREERRIKRSYGRGKGKRLEVSA